MNKVLIIGNPNVGKSTLFNSFTGASEHTGNFHGVTVDSKSKIIKIDNKDFTLVDLPGLYSLIPFSYEEEVSVLEIVKPNITRLVLTDANSIRKNLYLCLELIEMGLDFRLLINNYDYFSCAGNKIDPVKLSKKLGVEVEIIHAKKIKFSSKLFSSVTKQKCPDYIDKFVDIVNKKFTLPRDKIIRAFNGIFEGLNEEEIHYIKSQYEDIIQSRYEYLDKILVDCVFVRSNYIYGLHSADKVILNPLVMIIGFLITFLVGIYLIFFSLGSILSEGLVFVYERIIVDPIMDLIVCATDNIWLIEFFSGGIFSSLGTVLSFLPQVVLLFIFLTILEDSGIISRMSFVFDDFLSIFGLNGKAIYIMLMGLGCNTMSTMASRNMGDNNLKIKSAVINPYISCMARLPVYVVIASAFFGVKAYFVVVGLYLLGLVVALLTSLILTKTILPNKQNSMLLEFAPLRCIDLKHVIVVAKQNAIDMAKRIFTVVLCMGVIVWILSHTNFTLKYTADFTDSVLFNIGNILSPIFKPIGLGTAGIVSSLLVGVMAKELIISTMAICNNVSSNSALSLSLISTASVVNFTIPSAVVMLIFSLLYCPCISNIAVLGQETDKFYMWFALISQFTFAYVLSYVVYLSLTKGIIFSLLAVVVIAVILTAVIYVINMIKKRKCFGCTKCKRRNS